MRDECILQWIGALVNPLGSVLELDLGCNHGSSGGGRGLAHVNRDDRNPANNTQEKTSGKARIEFHRGFKQG